jgi:hypothetical protein
MFFGCSEKSDAPTQSTENTSNFSNLSLKKTTLNYDAINQSLEYIAISLARSLKQKEIGAKIKEEANKKFDGDYDI